MFVRVSIHGHSAGLLECRAPAIHSPTRNEGCVGRSVTAKFIVLLYERPVLQLLQGWFMENKLKKVQMSSLIPSLRTDQSEHRDNIWLTGQRCALPFIDIRHIIYGKLFIL